MAARHAAGGSTAKMRPGAAGKAPADGSGTITMPPVARKGNGWMILSLLLTGVLIAISAFPSFLVLVCGLAPAAVVALLGGRQARDTLACVLAANLCGVVPALVQLWLNGHSLTAVSALLSDVYIWATMYGAAAVGWFLLWLGPSMMRIVLRIAAEQNIRRLRAAQKRLVAEWGDEIVAAIRGRLSHLAPATSERDKGS